MCVCVCACDVRVCVYNGICIVMYVNMYVSGVTHIHKRTHTHTQAHTRTIHAYTRESILYKNILIKNTL